MLMTVCDDNTQIAEFIKEITVRNFPEIEVVIFASGKKMTEYIVKEAIPDIIISDICVGNEDGIEELKQVRDRLRYTRIIFLTGYFNRCQDIFISFNPYGLLTKPLQEDKLLYYLSKVVKEKALSENFYVFFRGNQFRLSEHDVLFIESVGRKVIYHTRKNDFEEYIKLDEAIQKVKQRFVRCHKSYAVNMDYITEQTGRYFLLKNGRTIPISKSYAKECKQKYISYLSENL